MQFFSWLEPPDIQQKVSEASALPAMDTNSDYQVWTSSEEEAGSPLVRRAVQDSGKKDDKIS